MPFTRARELLTHTGALSGQCLRYAPFMIPFDSPGQRAIVDALRAHLPQLDAVILFGSLATGHARADSDADLAVFGAAPYAAVQLFDARMAAEAVLRRTVDLVDLRRAPTVLQMQILKDGYYLLGQASVLAGNFELFIFRSYEDLQIKRRGLMEDIAARGTVHA